MIILYTIPAMADSKRRKWIIPVSVLFIVYFFIAATPISRQSVLSPERSAQLDQPKLITLDASAEQEIFPFRVYDYFGYATETLDFALVRQVKNHLAINETQFCEYPSQEERLTFRDAQDHIVSELLSDEHPFLRDGRIFTIQHEQHTVTAYTEDSKPLWQYMFEAPLSCADAASGLFVAGLLNGKIEIIGTDGSSLYSFSPGASRLPLISGVCISADASRIGLVSGIDKQRFLVLERAGATWRVKWHEYIGEGIRRPILMAFSDDARWIIYERENGIGVFDTQKKNSSFIPLNGRISALSRDTEDELLYLISSSDAGQELLEIQLPSYISLRTAFKGEDSFIHRQGERVFIGMPNALISLKSERR